ncbi:hypothetical protein OG911_11745 [Streptomyces sp. NBC_00208]|uniref:hypothetical protein n=1 Tax=Streptomyces sp. NBC_00208 TaxID=2975681 RepID=UPI002E2999DA|nr:hypothetical protein [Streptomyces sp. NBC_00208]
MRPGEEFQLPLLRELLPELVKPSESGEVRVMDLYAELAHVYAAAGHAYMPLGTLNRCLSHMGHGPHGQRGVYAGLDWLSPELFAEIVNNRPRNKRNH